MTTTDSLASTLNSTNSASTSSTTAGGFSSLTSDQFTKIILTELQNQDPLQPSDTNALLQQLSTIRNIQSDMDLTTKLGSLVSQNQFTSASSVIGKVVSGLATDSTNTMGVVSSVSKTTTNVYLNLNNGKQVDINNLQGIIDPSSLTTTEKQLLGITS
jgi:flagellar basal-body rod modification protein FlgD